jgi:hypothetical protein
MAADGGAGIRLGNGPYSERQARPASAAGRECSRQLCEGPVTYRDVREDVVAQCMICMGHLWGVEITPRTAGVKCYCERCCDENECQVFAAAAGNVWFNLCDRGSWRGGADLESWRAIALELQ